MFVRALPGTSRPVENFYQERRWKPLPVCFPLLVPERLDRVEPPGADGRVETDGRLHAHAAAACVKTTVSGGLPSSPCSMMSAGGFTRQGRLVGPSALRASLVRALSDEELTVAFQTTPRAKSVSQGPLRPIRAGCCESLPSASSAADRSRFVAFRRSAALRLTDRNCACETQPASPHRSRRGPGHLVREQPPRRRTHLA